MKIIIDINEHLYKTIKTLGLVVEDGDAVAVSEAIANGVPLPEHHGRLIDADALQTEMEKDVRKAMSFVDLKDFVWLAPTIIEADR